MGTIQMALPSTSVLTSYNEEIGVLDMPYLFKDSQSAFDALDGDLGSQISEWIAGNGFVSLGYTYNGPRCTTNSVHPISTPADLAGLKIRVMSSPVFIRMYEVLGANPTPMSFSEVFTGLQQNVINGQENPPTLIYASGFQEVQKYLNFTNHILYLNQIIINNDKFNSLDPLYQDALTQAVEEAIAELRPALTELDKSSKDTLAAGGMEMVEYAPEFYDEILNLQGVQDLYTKIDGEVDGLGTILQDELAAVAGA